MLKKPTLQSQRVNAEGITYQVSGRERERERERERCKGRKDSTRYLKKYNRKFGEKKS